MSDPTPPKTPFESAADAPDDNLFAEFWGFLRDNKKWWLLPILAVLVIMALIVLLGTTGAAPFIYTLF